MFDRLKKVFSSDAVQVNRPAAHSAGQTNAVSAWAGKQGFSYAPLGDSQGFTVSGQVAGKLLKLERGRSSRDYIRGEELRARAELNINEDVSVLIMNRHLKEALEKRAYSMYTDTLQTTADPNLPEEMRWLAMYPEVGWDELAPSFWERYTVLADDRDQAFSLLNQDLANLLMNWPKPGPDEQVPFILMLLRGKAYLRMQYTPSDLPTLEHAVSIFTTACESAVAGLAPDISI